MSDVYYLIQVALLMCKLSQLAIKLLLRDWRSGELKVLFLSLVIAVASVTSIGLFSQRIDRSMNHQAGEFLGADLILNGTTSLDEDNLSEARKHNLKTSQTISFSSVIVANDEFQLAHIKAVDKNYPLLNSIRISDEPYGDEQVSYSGPASGEAWLAPRLISALKVSLNEYIEVGQIQLKVTAILKHDPGQTTSLISIAPRLLMNISDVVNSGIVQPGSRVTYSQLFTGTLADRQSFEKWLKPELKADETLVGGTESSQAINSAVEKARQYLSLASMLSVLLSGIAIAMSANRYAQRHYDQVALMRCIGSTQSNILQIYITQLILLGVTAAACGVVTGYIAQQMLSLLLHDVFSSQLPSAGVYPYIIGFMSGFITLIGFSLPAILRLRSVSPLRVLRHELSPLPIQAWLVYSLAASSIVLLMWWQSGNLTITLLVMTGTFLCILALLVLSILLTTLSRILYPTLSGPWKLGLQQILRNQRQNQLQILSLGLSLFILMIIYLIHSDLLDRWKNQLPDNAPNHFVINIQQYEIEPVRSFLKSRQIYTEGIYPMIRGRITSINGKLVSEMATETKKLDPALKRDLNLSWMNKLQQNNRILRGNWFDANSNGKPLISIEEGLARRLNLVMGDNLIFSIADQRIVATVHNIRKVDWESFQPNFFIIFPENVINKFPATYISSFYLDKTEKKLLNELIREYPTLTVLELDDIMNQVRSIMDKVSAAIKFVMLFVLVAGLMVMTASIQSSMESRSRNAAIMRTLGASRSYLRNSLLAEISLLGIFSGLLAVIGTEFIAYLLYLKIFDLDYQLHITLWITGPLIGISIILLTSWIYLRKIPDQSPVKILRYS